jgi:hypothetical protein
MHLAQRILVSPFPNANYIGPDGINAPQLHATQTHTHDASSNVIDPGHAHIMSSQNNNYDNDAGNFFALNDKPSFARKDDGTRQWTIESGTINSNTTGISVTTTVNNSTLSVNANETRPYNYGVYWIIKY